MPGLSVLPEELLLRIADYAVHRLLSHTSAGLWRLLRHRYLSPNEGALATALSRAGPRRLHSLRVRLAAPLAAGLLWPASLCSLSLLLLGGQLWDAITGFKAAPVYVLCASSATALRCVPENARAAAG